MIDPSLPPAFVYDALAASGVTSSKRAAVDRDGNEILTKSRAFTSAPSVEHVVNCSNYSNNNKPNVM